MFMIKAVPWHDMGPQLGPIGVRAGNGRVVVRPVVGEVASVVPDGGCQQARRCTCPRPAAYSGLLRAAFGWPRRTPTVRWAPSYGPVKSAAQQRSTAGSGVAIHRGEPAFCDASCGLQVRLIVTADQSELVGHSGTTVTTWRSPPTCSRTGATGVVPPMRCRRRCWSPGRSICCRSTARRRRFRPGQHAQRPTTCHRRRRR
jgi:hypothetical protein